MQRTPIKKIGKKGKEWINAKKKLLKTLEKSGEYKVIGSHVYGICKDCGHYRELTPDHIVRRSHGGSHESSNIDWVCWPCHFKRDNMTQDKKPAKKKNNKPDWMREHACVKCKEKTSSYLCHVCGQVSVK